MVIRKLKNLLYSPQAAMYLMVTIFGYILFGLYSGDLMGNPYTTWWFILVEVLLVVNLLACTIKRFMRQHNRAWGSLIFHFGLAVVMTGFCINSLWGMSGKMLTIQGSVTPFPEELTFHRQGYLYNFNDKFGVRMDQLTPEGINNTLQQVRSSLTFITSSNVETKQVEVNYPADYRQMAWRSQSWGFSAYLQIKDSSGQPLVDDYVNIATHGGKIHYDNLDLPGGYQLRVDFYPDFVADKGGSSKSQIPHNPVVKINIKHGGDNTTAFVAMNQQTIAGPYIVAFPEYRYWQLMHVSHDPGEILIYLGGFMAVLGIAWRAFQFEIVARQEQQVLGR